MTEPIIATPYQSIQETLKQDIGKLGTINIKMHPAGGYDKKTGFVCEPIGEFKYLFKFKGYKGIAEGWKYGEFSCPSCGTLIKKIERTNADKTAIKCGCGRRGEIPIEWRLITDLDNLIIKFENKPIDKVIFNIPSQAAIDFWLNNEMVDENGDKINEQLVYNVVKSYLKAFYDLPIEISYDMLTLAVLQSWVIDILDVIFYVATAGETGSGKTALLEALIGICKHGIMAGDIKGAGIARCIEKYKLSLGMDEIDSKKGKEDDNSDSICRQGYRRGQLYIRMAPMSHEPEFFNVFGFKAFTFRSEIVDDLQNRSIDVPINKTKSQELPIINLFKQHYSPFELLFFWYLDNIAELYLRTPAFSQEQEVYSNNVNSVNKVNTVNMVNVNNIYKGDVKRDTAIQKTPYLLNCINAINKKSIFGRNVEIAYLIYSLSQILKIDIDSILSATIEQKQEMEEASSDEGWIGVLKEILSQEYSNAEWKDDLRVITYKVVIGKYIYRIKEMFDNIPSEYNVRRLLRQVGFVDGINRKVMRLNGKPKLCLIYDKKIKESIGIDVPESEEIKIEEQTK